MGQRVCKHLSLVSILVVLSAFLGGCLYPEERMTQNQVPSSFYMESTQKAIEHFQADTSVLPIVTKSFDTPIFEKYEIDFRKLIPKYLPDTPANAFEKGGLYKYVLIDAETNPTVKLIHLGVVSKVDDAQRAVNRYLGNRGKLPIKEDIGNGYYSIDFGKIGMKETQVESMVSNQLLQFVINGKGEVGIDYTSDIATVLRNSNIQVPANTDPRYVMVRESIFVPIKSFPYEMFNGEPRLLEL